MVGRTEQMTKEQILFKEKPSTLSTFGHTVYDGTIVLYVMDEYAKQRAWEAWKYRATLSEDTQMSEFFLSWWEGCNK